MTHIQHAAATRKCHPGEQLLAGVLRDKTRPSRIPRLFRLLDPVAFRSWFIVFMQRFAETCQGVVALDGKTLRRSFDRASATSPLHLVSAWAADQRLVLGQLAVGAKSNEIVAVPKLLELLSLRGTIDTADALNCQRQIAAQFLEQGGGGAQALKGNQPALFDDERRFLDDPETPLVSASETDAGHGDLPPEKWTPGYAA